MAPRTPEPPIENRADGLSDRNQPPLTDLPEGFVWFDPFLLLEDYGVDVPNPITHAELIQLVVETVAKWRFTPVIVEGQVTKVCSRKTFEISFH